MNFQMSRGANVPRLLAAASAFLLAAACRDLPTATPVDALKQPATPARDLLTLDPLCGVGILGADGTLGSGAQWLVCKPPLWNGSVIVWAHGYVDPTNPLRLPDDVIEGARIRDIALGLGYAYATTSYRHTGLVAAEGSHDLDDALGQYIDRFGSPPPGTTPPRAYLVGASEGSLSSILALERTTTQFSGALAVCGPIGSFRGQINYFGDFRVLFDYFFPGVLPGTAIRIPQDLINHWDDRYVPAIVAAVTANQDALTQLLRVSHAPAGSSLVATIDSTVIGLLWYNVFATNDAATRLGGNPYDNRTRIYLGSSNDLRLNLLVKRFTASPTALANLKAFETTGGLQRPVVSLHTTADPIIPFWQQELYQLKWLTTPHLALFAGFPVSRYGHCQFTMNDVLLAFGGLVQETGGPPLIVPASLFLSQTEASQFLELSRSRGANATVIR